MLFKIKNFDFFIIMSKWHSSVLLLIIFPVLLMLKHLKKKFSLCSSGICHADLAALPLSSPKSYSKKEWYLKITKLLKHKRTPFLIATLSTDSIMIIVIFIVMHRSQFTWQMTCRLYWFSCNRDISEMSSFLF